jgi:hypothetical protein
MNREYIDLMAVDKKLEKEMRRSQKVYEWWSLLSPGTPSFHHIPEVKIIPGQYRTMFLAAAG